MKKIILIIVITAIVTSVITAVVLRFSAKDKDASVFFEERMPVRFTKNTKAASSAGNPDFVQAAAKVSPAVVHIKTVYAAAASGYSNPIEELFGMPRSSRPVRASGSGVLISPDGYIVTNNHVVENASRVEVVLPDKRSFNAKVIGTDPSTDLALVKIDGNNLPFVGPGNSDDVQVGEWVLAVGYPLSLSSTVTAGIVSAKGRSIGLLDQAEENNGSGGGSTAIESFIQTDAAINPGNSGGALVNSAGQLIGINSAIASQTGSYAGYGFAIPVNLARKVVNDFKKFGEVRRGYMGVSFPAPAVEDQLLRQQGIDPASVKGVYITGVQPGSAAASAGLKSKDVIKSIDGVEITSSAEFSERIARRRPGDKVDISYLRNGKSFDTSVTLKGRDSASQTASTRSDLEEKLGATFAPLNEAVKQRYRLRAGLVIVSVQEGGFFDQAGIPRGTVITLINGQPVNTPDDLNKVFGTARSGMIRVDGITPDGRRFVFNFPLGA